MSFFSTNMSCSPELLREACVAAVRHPLESFSWRSTQAIKYEFCPCSPLFRSDQAEAIRCEWKRSSAAFSVIATRLDFNQSGRVDCCLSSCQRTCFQNGTFSFSPRQHRGPATELRLLFKFLSVVGHCFCKPKVMRLLACCLAMQLKRY